LEFYVRPFSDMNNFVLLFVTNDDHSVAKWFEVSDFTSDLENLIFDNGFGFSDYYEDSSVFKFNHVDETEKLKEFISNQVQTLNN